MDSADILHYLIDIIIYFMELMMKKEFRKGDEETYMPDVLRIACIIALLFLIVSKITEG